MYALCGPCLSFLATFFFHQEVHSLQKYECGLLAFSCLALPLLDLYEGLSGKLTIDVPSQLNM